MPSVTPRKHQPDHILPRQHRGLTDALNLALACYYCNHNKGSHIGSYDLVTGRFAPLFNPRTQHWGTHFRLNEAVIGPLTPEGRVTEFLMRFNDSERVDERHRLLRLGLY